MSIGLLQYGNLPKGKLYYSNLHCLNLERVFCKETDKNLGLRLNV